MKKFRSYRQGISWSLGLILALLVIDQFIKLSVKCNMSIGESHRIASWFYIYFIENNGIAFGLSFIYKPVLTILRIVVLALLGFYMHKVIIRRSSIAYIVCLSLIFAGAAGNIIDCVFYGQLFDYAPILQGRVVDMFYFPIIQTHYPDWFPFYGGREFIFFSPIFNFADACISVGVIAVLLFFRKELERVKVVINC